MNDQSGCGCGCFVVMLVIATAVVACPRQTATTPPYWGLVVTAFSAPDAQAEQQARRRVDQLQLAGWGSAGYRGWKSLQDGNEFQLCYLRLFDSETALEHYKDVYQAELQRFPSLRSFKWVENSQPETDDTYLIRLAAMAVTITVTLAAAYCSCYLLMGWPLGTMAGLTVPDAGRRGCLASFIPGYETGYRSGLAWAAKRTAAQEERRGDFCISRRPLSELLGETE